MLSNRVSFRHPSGGDAAPRTGLLLPGFKRTPTVRSFAPEPGSHKWLDQLAAFQPQSLGASLGQLLYLAGAQELLSSKLECLRHSLVVIFQTEQPWLSHRHRDILWRAFGLPLYAQIYCASGLLATECEAHDGLHVAKGAEWTCGERGELWYREPAAWWEDRGESYAPSGFFGAVESTECDCGRKTPRLKIDVRTLAAVA